MPILPTPYQPPSPVQTIGQLYAMRAQQQEMAMRQQQMAVQQQEMQQRDIAMQREAQQWQWQQQANAAIAHNMGKDPQGNPTFDQGGYERELATSGNPGYFPAVQGGLERTKTLAGINQTNADTGLKIAQTATAHLAARKDALNLGGQIVNGISDQHSYDAAVPQLEQLGVIPPGSAPIIFDPKNKPAFLQQLQQQSLTTDQLMSQLQKQAELAQTEQRDKNTDLYHRGELGMRGAQLGIDRSRLGIEQQRLGLEYGLTGGGNNLTGDAFLQTLPTSMQGQVKGIANGDLPMPNSRSGPGLMLSRAVTQYDPGYTTARYTSKQNFKTGADAQVLQNLATTLGHIDNLKGTSDALGVAPFLGTHLQSAKDAGLSAALQGASGEIGKLITGGVVPEGEFNALKESMSSMRPDVRSAAIDKFKELIADRIAGIQQKYKAATGQELPAGEFFDAVTQQRLQKLQGGAQESKAQVTPGSHIFNLGNWMRAHPNGNPKAAADAARAQGFTVVTN